MKKREIYDRKKRETTYRIELSVNEYIRLISYLESSLKEEHLLSYQPSERITVINNLVNNETEQTN